MWYFIKWLDVSGVYMCFIQILNMHIDLNKLYEFVISRCMGWVTVCVVKKLVKIIREEKTVAEAYVSNELFVNNFFANEITWLCEKNASSTQICRWYYQIRCRAECWNCYPLWNYSYFMQMLLELDPFLEEISLVNVKALVAYLICKRAC